MNRIRVLIDVVVDRANTALRSFRERLSEAEGATGKLRVAGQQAFSFLRANAVEFATAAGGALVAFGARSVGAFNALALEVGKFSEATGLATQDASRWIEVAGDLNIEAGVLERSLGKLSREIATNAAGLDEYGIAAVRASNGTVDMNATFLATLDRIRRIKDPTERAAAAQQAFGRSWQEMAELIGTSADDLKAALDDVSDAKVIDDAEVARARQYRASMDRLRDTVDDLQLTIGGKLVPVVDAAATGIGDMVELGEKLKLLDLAEEFWSWTTPLGIYAKTKDIIVDDLDHLIGKHEELRAELERRGFSEEQIAEILAKHGDAAKDTADDTEALTDAERAAAEARQKNIDAVKRAVAAVDLEARALESNTRRRRDAVTEAEEHARALDELAAAQSRLIGGEIGVRDAQRRATDALREYEEAAANGARSAERLLGLQQQVVDAERGADAADRAVDDARRAASEADRAAQDARRRDADEAEIARLDDEARRARENVYGAEDRARDAQGAIDQARRRVAEEERKASPEELAALRDRATEAQLRAAQAAADYAADLRIANGETLTNIDRQSILRDAISDLATALGPQSPLRSNLAGYVADLDGMIAKQQEAADGIAAAQLAAAQAVRDQMAPRFSGFAHKGSAGAGTSVVNNSYTYVTVPPGTPALTADNLDRHRYLNGDR